MVRKLKQTVKSYLLYLRSFLRVVSLQ